MILKCNFHNHTEVSFDSWLKPEKLLIHYEKKGFTHIAITDHNKIEGAFKASEVASKLGINLTIIIGEEISTTKGEIIGLFLEDEIKPSNPEDVIQAVKSQGGLVYLPHPFKRGEIWKYSNLMNMVDAVEVWNGRASYEENYKAILLCKLYSKLPLAGSDAHLKGEIGNTLVKLQSEIPVTNDLRKVLLYEDLQIEIYGKLSNPFNETLSQFIKFTKTKNLKSVKHGFSYAVFRNTLKFLVRNPNKININFSKQDMDIKLYD